MTPAVIDGTGPVRRRSAGAHRAANERRAILAVMCAVMLWGGSAVAIKAISVTGLVTAFYRLWFAIPLLWAVPLAQPAIRARLTSRWFVACLVGGTLFFLHQALFFTSLKLTTVANVTLIGALQPAIVLLAASPLFDERPTFTSVLWTAVAFGGTVLVVLGARRSGAWSLYGDTLAFANLFAFCGYFLASKYFRRDVRALEYVIGMTTVSGVWMLGAVLATGHDLAAPRGWEWPVLFAIAALPGTLGHLLTNWAHAHATALSISMILLAAPVVATVGAKVFLDEELSWMQALGGLIVLTAITIVIRSTPPETSEELAESAAETDAP